MTAESETGRGNARQTGTNAERLAMQYLEVNGVRILEHNFNSRQGEIDLIGQEGDYLVFIEVKYRSTGRNGSPEEAVGPAKQRRICKTADYYRCRHRIASDMPIRFDVVAVGGTGEQPEVRWYPDAFPYIGGGW